MTRLAYSPAIGYASVDSDGSVIEFLTGPCCSSAELMPYGTEHECQSSIMAWLGRDYLPEITGPHSFTGQTFGRFREVSMTVTAYNALSDEARGI